jgi:hypothetical protein
MAPELRQHVAKPLVRRLPFWCSAVHPTVGLCCTSLAAPFACVHLQQWLAIAAVAATCGLQYMYPWTRRILVATGVWQVQLNKQPRQRPEKGVHVCRAAMYMSMCGEE